ncbi:MAG TPA: hypothetical protein GX015_01445, partial [Corynebacterium sp.]|nr:hypothetical protein [Corynebacterium sp.]
LGAGLAARIYLMRKPLLPAAVRAKISRDRTGAKTGAAQTDAETVKVNA